MKQAIAKDSSEIEYFFLIYLNLASLSYTMRNNSDTWPPGDQAHRCHSFGPSAVNFPGLSTGTLENGGKEGGGGRGDSRRGKTGLKTISAGNTDRSKIQTQAETGKLQARMNPRWDRWYGIIWRGIWGGRGEGQKYHTLLKKRRRKSTTALPSFQTQMIRD